MPQIRIQRLDECWEGAESIPLSAFMRYTPVRQHICGHISNKPKVKIGRLLLATGAGAIPFGNFVNASARKPMGNTLKNAATIGCAGTPTLVVYLRYSRYNTHTNYTQGNTY